MAPSVNNNQNIKINLSNIKAGTKRANIKTADEKSIFDKLDKNKDGVLQKGEVSGEVVTSKNNKKYVKIKSLDNGRSLVLGADGKSYVMAHDGVILKESYVAQTTKPNKDGNVTVGENTYKKVVDKRGYTRVYDVKGNLVSAQNAQGKSINPAYLEACDDFDKNSKTHKTSQNGISYGVSKSGACFYFDEKGHVITGEARKAIIQKEIVNATNLLKKGANGYGLGVGTNDEVLNKGVKSIYSKEIMAGVNNALKQEGYDSNSQTTPIEDLLISEQSRTEARASIRQLANQGAYGNKAETSVAIGRNSAREIEYELHGGIGYTGTAELKDAIGLATTRNERLQTEKALAKIHPELIEKKDSGSVVRAAIKEDGWENDETDRFDAVWVKNNAYTEAQYKIDENGNEVLVSNPKITALYTDDIDNVPVEYLIKAQEENLPIVIIK